MDFSSISLPLLLHLAAVSEAAAEVGAGAATGVASGTMSFRLYRLLPVRMIRSAASSGTPMDCRPTSSCSSPSSAGSSATRSQRSSSLIVVGPPPWWERRIPSSRWCPSALAASTPRSSSRRNSRAWLPAACSSGLTSIARPKPMVPSRSRFPLLRAPGRAPKASSASTWA